MSEIQLPVRNGPRLRHVNPLRNASSKPVCDCELPAVCAPNVRASMNTMAEVQCLMAGRITVRTYLQYARWQRHGRHQGTEPRASGGGGIGQWASVYQ